MGGDGTRTFAVMAKVVGGLCNLRCVYCYYAEKPGLLAQKLKRMPDDVLESYIRQNLEINGRDAVVEFAWHGGEPLLAGHCFFPEGNRSWKRGTAGEERSSTPFRPTESFSMRNGANSSPGTVSSWG
jgi:uncharacterized protein